MRYTRPATRRLVLSAIVVAAAAPLCPAAGLALEPGPERILVFGDSQAQGLAGGVQRLYRRDRKRRVLDHTKISTGLNRHSSTDWPAQAQMLATTEHADVAVAMFGANDRPPVRIGGAVDERLMETFTAWYGARVTSVATSFADAGVPLIWVGHPIVRDPAFNEDMAMLNDIFSSHAKAAGATFVSTWDTFKGPDGGYSPYGKGLNGETQRLRADDGVHLTPAGYDVVTAMLQPFFDQYRTHPATSPTASAAPRE